MDKESLTAEQFHNRVTQLAVDCQNSSSKTHNHDSFPIINYAIFNIFHEAIIIHRSIGGLVFSGWSSSGAILTRTLLDLTVSLFAIIKSSSPNLAAFRYFNSNHRQILRSSDFSLELKSEIKNILEDQISQFSANEKDKANKIKQEKDRAYWFGGEWNSPTEVLKKFAPDLLAEYKSFSSASHGGFYGLMRYRDGFNEYGIDPRLPIGKTAMLVSVFSSRKLIDLVSIRSSYENLGLENACKLLIDSIENIIGLYDELK